MDFEAYVAESRSTLVRFATVVTDDAHLAQDIVQEVLVRTQRKWHLIESMTYPEAYVRRMIVNEARSGWRRTKRVEPRSDIDTGASAADHSLTYERRDELRRRLLQLPPKQRAAIVMRYLEDLPDVEIAATLNCTVSTVRVHVHRALARMRVDAADDPSRADPSRTDGADGVTPRSLPVPHVT